MKRLVMACGCLVAGIAGALEYKWQYPVGGEGYWENMLNWEKQDAGVGVDLPGPGDSALFDWNGGVAEDALVRSVTGGVVGFVAVREDMRTVTFDLTPGAVIETKNFDVLGIWDAVPEETRWNAAVVKSGTILAQSHITVGGGQRSRASLTATGPDTLLKTEAKWVETGEDSGYWDGGYDISTECNNGFGNSIIVSNQAQVISARGFGVGSNHPGDPGTGSNCWALVSGAGTYLQTGGGCLLVGNRGPDNALTVEKGAVVAPVVHAGNWPSGVHIGKYEGADRNLILVREGGAITNAACPWSIIGGSGSHNCLRITDAGSHVILGATAVGGDRYGGYPNGTSNALEVLDGSSMEVNNLVVGAAEGADYNRLTVDNATFTSIYEIILGLRGNTNSIDIRNQGQLAILERPFYIGESTDMKSTHGNICTLSDVGSEIVAAGGFRIGAYGCTGNELHINEGTARGNGDMMLGYGAGAANNRVRLTNGGKCYILSSINIGTESGADGNEIYIGGEGSALETMDYDLTLGECGQSNRIVVADGGLLHINRGLYIGGFPGNDESRLSIPSNNVLRVENGRVELPSHSGWSGWSSLLVRNEGRIEIAGTNSCIAAKRIRMDDSSTLRFELETVPVQTPLMLDLADLWDNWVVIADTARLEIDAERLARNGGCKGFALIETGAFAAPALSNLVNNVTFVSGEGSVYLNQEETALLLNVHSQKATVITVK